MDAFFKFNEGTSLSKSELLRTANKMENLNKDVSYLDRPLVKEMNLEYNEITTRTPENNGSWSGMRGNSAWMPDRDYIPPEKSRNPETSPYSNPENLTWGEILEKNKIEGVEFKNGFPVFQDISRGTVEIENFQTGGCDAKDKNFKQADIAMAEKNGYTPNEVKQWRKENNFTWHECEDKRTMQKVSNEVHANIPHDGGRSQ